MKKYLLFMFLALISSAACSQVYYPILGDSISWQVNTYAPVGAGLVSHNFFTAGDTIVTGQSYKKVTNGFGNMELWREDTLTQKVYNHSGLSEQLLYDFSLNLYDSITITWFNGWNQQWMTRTLIVDSISYPVYNSGPRKFMRLRGGVEVNWLESVGCIYCYSLIYNQTQGFDGSTDTIVCQKRNGNFSYEYSPSITCFPFSSLSNMSSEYSFSLQPNPATTSLTIQTENNFPAQTTFQLFDLSGRMVLQEDLRDKTSRVELSALSKGMYLYSVVRDREKVGAGKLVIE